MTSKIVNCQKEVKHMTSFGNSAVLSRLCAWCLLPDMHSALTTNNSPSHKHDAAFTKDHQIH